ncbi:PREDICTED: acyl-CoA-binding domain-containing protein 4 isoform X3 [Condylura cristata]|uniref:acyl-CoA-binding domain-containing protein 4 isoform X3 n=1 Tax=Condylura cristata TaxID=143302 RepID=UPI0006428C1D|nr:PREDICTED: acyl-CoA-binding domain-containing protein 4 isoform X3 [Condylura cristata]
MGTESESPEPDCQKQFQAAVSVIQNLPKNGSYRPSYEEMLRFYSYYKQATMGPCLVPRPGFWDPIGRYKWDAWNSLGKMSREEAMSAYITEMKLVAQKSLRRSGTWTLRFSVTPWSSWSLRRCGQSSREPLDQLLRPHTAPALTAPLRKRDWRAACWGPRNWTSGWWEQFERCRRACGMSRGDCRAWRVCPAPQDRSPHPGPGLGPSVSLAPRCSSSSCGPSSSSGSSDSFGLRRGDCPRRGLCSRGGGHEPAVP